MTAQLISILTIPIITRMYTPEEFGTFALFMSLLFVLAPVSTLTYTTPIMLPEDNKDSWALGGLAVICSLLFSAIMYLLIVLARYFDGEYFFTELVRNTSVWLLPIGVFITATLMSIDLWLIRRDQVDNVTIGRVIASVSERGIAILLGLTGSNAIGLVLGRVVGTACSVIYLGKAAISNLPSGLKMLSAERMLYVARRYKNFAIYSTWATLFGNIAKEIPIILLAWLYSPVIAGYYALSKRVINMPMMFLGDAISKLFYQRASAAKNENVDVSENLVELIVFLYYLCCPFLLVIVVFGDDTFTLVFGDQWRECGFYAQLLSIYFLTSMIKRPVEVYFDVQESQKAKLAFTVIGLVLTCATIGVGSLLAWSAIWTLTMFSAVLTVANLVTMIYVFNMIQLSPWAVFLTFLKKTVIISPLIIAMVALKMIMPVISIFEMAIICCLIVLQYVFIVIADSKVKTRFLQLWRQRLSSAG